MKKSDLKLEIKNYIYEILSEESIEEITYVSPKTNPSEAGEIAKGEGTDINTVKGAINKARQTNTSVGVAENNLDKSSILKKLREE